MNNEQTPQLNIPCIIKREFKKGDKVEIIGNIPFVLKDKPLPLLGKVTHVDGFYISVKPLYQRWEGEWYYNELRHV